MRVKKTPSVTSPSVMRTESTTSITGTNPDDWNSQAFISIPNDDLSVFSTQLTSSTASRSNKGYIILDQSDMYTHVFVPIQEQKVLGITFAVLIII